MHPCTRLRFPQQVAWRILRFAGCVSGPGGSVIGIAGSEAELTILQQAHGSRSDFVYTGPGMHDQQLTVAQFFALLRSPTGRVSGGLGPVTLLNGKGGETLWGLSGSVCLFFLLFLCSDGIWGPSGPVADPSATWGLVLLCCIVCLSTKNV